MAYSRWTDSFWYTFWAVAEHGVVEDRDNAVFEVMPHSRFAAKDLRENQDRCVEEVVYRCCSRNLQPTEADIEELRGYMNEFLEDVDKEHFPGTPTDEPR